MEPYLKTALLFWAVWDSVYVVHAIARDTLTRVHQLMCAVIWAVFGAVLWFP